MGQEALDRHPYGFIELSSELRDFLVCHINREMDEEKLISDDIKTVLSIDGITRQTDRFRLECRVSSPGNKEVGYYKSEHTATVYIDDNKFLKLERNFKIDQIL